MDELMSDGVQTAYNSVLGKAGIALGAVAHVRQDILPARVGRWNLQSFPQWTMDWGGAEGIDQCLISADGTRMEFTRPSRSWAIYAPGVTFGERFRHPERNREFLWLFFSLTGALPPLSARPFTLVMDRDDLLADQVRAMAAVQKRGAQGDALAAHGRFLTVLGTLLSAAESIGGDHLHPWRLPGEDDDVSSLLAVVDALVMRALSTPPPRAQLASALGMSESALAHRFRAETGMTIPERVRWLRIREAKARLEERDASVKAVAASLGFSSAFYFSRVFSEVAGTSPSEYLARLRG